MHGFCGVCDICVVCKGCGMLYVVCVYYMWGGVHVCVTYACACAEVKGQTSVGWFSPPAMWAPGTELSSSGWTASASTH